MLSINSLLADLSDNHITIHINIKYSTLIKDFYAYHPICHHKVKSLGTDEHVIMLKMG